ncbi:unnamed protein product [Clonostachys chloroleuca]|uniref:Putative phospholipase n=1 Tax=Clonostachys chloroleuca TaxID=1926264 RepID=A0AA35MAZ5_9HYPO|nr:unnamed protein product [Clonostachys chloroleuca]
MRPPEDFELEALIDNEEADDLLSAPDAPLSMPASPDFGAHHHHQQPKWLTQSRHRSWIRSIPYRIIARVWPLLRPRLTWRYILSSLVTLYILFCFITRQPLLASNLPGYTGTYGVGAVDVEVPLPGGTKRISEAAFKSSGDAAFEVETVLVSIYYPTSREYRSPKPRYYWIPKPVSLTAAGYAKLAHVDNFIMRPVFTFFLWAVGGGITIPAEVDAPLLSADEIIVPITTSSLKHRDDAPYNTTFPITVFSHGMASSRTDYTNFLGELASRGHIIAAVEHRDGSCPGSLVKLDPKDPGRRVLPLRQSDLSEPMETPDLKRTQLAFRDAEILGAVHLLRSINAGDHIPNSRAALTTLPSWAGRLNLDFLTIAGHSYGATGALQALTTVAGPTSSSSSSSSGDYDTLPASAGIILDPGKGSGPLNHNTTQPLLVIHSNSWSRPSSALFHGRPHFDTVRDLVASSPSPSWFLTAIGTSHPSVTDAPLLEPLLLSWTTGAGLDVRGALAEYVAAAADFLAFVPTGSVSEGSVLAQAATHREYDKWVSKEREEEFPKAMAKLWEVHVSPETKQG